MDDLQALAGAVLDEAKNLLKYMGWAHWATFGLLILSIFLAGGWLYGSVVFAAVIGILAQVLMYLGEAKNSLGHELLRANMLSSAFGRKSNIDITYLKQNISAKALEKAPEFHKENYYSSDEQAGEEKLCAMIQESSFWSQHLYKKCSQRSFMYLIPIFTSIVLAGITFAAIGEKDPNYTTARMVLVCLSLVPLWKELSKAISWRNASAKLSLLDHRLENIDVSNEEDLVLSVFADYSIVTASSPLIPQKIYEMESERLNALWEERQRS